MTNSTESQMDISTLGPRQRIALSAAVLDLMSETFAGVLSRASRDFTCRVSDAAWAVVHGDPGASLQIELACGAWRGVSSDIQLDPANATIDGLVRAIESDCGLITRPRNGIVLTVDEAQGRTASALAAADAHLKAIGFDNAAAQFDALYGEIQRVAKYNLDLDRILLETCTP